ncbi:K(+)-transporting ATPase subunit F [Lysinibacillus alkalisoli]
MASCDGVLNKEALNVWLLLSIVLLLFSYLLYALLQPEQF